VSFGHLVIAASTLGQIGQIICQDFSADAKRFDEERRKIDRDFFG
jgi:hypothetical protein